MKLVSQLSLLICLAPALLLVWGCDEGSPASGGQAVADPKAMAIDPDWTYGRLDEPVTLTRRASREINAWAKAQQFAEDWRLRVSNEGGQELAQITLDHSPEQDIYYVSHGVPMAVEREKVGVVLGVTLDVVEPFTAAEGEVKAPTFAFSYASEGG